MSGDTGEDFFATLDRDGSGDIDAEEARSFFTAAAEQMASMGGAQPKDEM